jgi:hypothetical protein
MLRSRQIQHQLDNLLTAQDLSRMFRKTSMTISLWRRQRDLPAVVIKFGRRNVVRFVAREVQEWARKNEIPMVKDC